MDLHPKIWIYPDRTRRVGGGYDIHGSMGHDRVIVVLDRDVTPFVSESDPQRAIKANQAIIQETAARLFDQDHISKVADDRAPQFFHWQVAITRADLEETTGAPL